MLIRHADTNEEKLQVERLRCVHEGDGLAEVFDVLVRKFRKLRKTKEEMTKYCMRKAFKFLGDKHKRALDGRETGEFLKEYFERVEGEAFSVPFRKNSEDKTMNTSFLRKVFGCPGFLADYQLFLSKRAPTQSPS